MREVWTRAAPLVRPDALEVEAAHREGAGRAAHEVVRRLIGLGLAILTQGRIELSRIEQPVPLLVV